MDNLLMSRKELSRLEVMQRLSEKRMSQKEAGTILGLRTRQIKRLLKAYREKGAVGLVSKHRGRTGNNRLADEVKKRALDLLKTKYKGFGPTLAHEKLVERDKLRLSDESVRQLMIAEDLWKPRKAKKVVTHQLRERRACFGELVQIDGSPHDWFEGRAEPCVLLVFIDDATGQVLQLRFVESESFFSYAQAADEYFRRCGKPVAFYSDMLRKWLFSGECAIHWLWRVPDPVWTRDASIGYPDHLCQHASGQRPRRTSEPDFARSPGQGDAFTRHLQQDGWQRLFARVHDRSQPTLCRGTQKYCQCPSPPHPQR